MSFDADFFCRDVTPVASQWISGFWISGFLVVASQWSVSESMVNSHRVTTVSRQAVKCEARNPCIHDHDNIKSAEGTTKVFFCRTFGALIFLQSYSAGIPHCVLHHLPGNCRPYRTFLPQAASFELRASLLMAHSS